MGELSYISQAHIFPHQTSLSCIMTDGTRAPSTHIPSTSSYPELTTPYSAVSSFNYPTHADATLLTPVSAADSPPMHQSHKFAGRYAPSGPPHTQEATTPATTRMYSWQPMDMHGAGSQTGSPLPQQGQVPHEYLTSAYMPSERRLTPGPPEQSYTGSYGVSEGSEHHGLHQPESHYYMHMPPIEQPADGLMARDDTSMVLEPDRDSLRMAHTPLLGQPNVPHSQSGGKPNGKSSSVQSTPEVPRSMAPSHASKSASHGGSNNQRRRSSAPRVRKHKSAPRKGSQGRTGSPGTDPSDDHKNCLGQETAPRLKPSCPPEERCIFEARWENRRKKGQDMWEAIQSTFEKQFNQKYNKEMLQMRFKRARSKFYDWLPEDEEILREAFVEMERERYETLLEKFYEKGGSRNMQLSAGDIEIKLATDMKLEEGFYLDSYPDLGIRRRQRKLAARRRQVAHGDDGEGAGPDDLASVDSHNTTNEDEVIRQVHTRRGLSWDDASNASTGMMDLSMQMKM